MTRGTIQNWESEATPISDLVKNGCQIWESRLRQIQPDVGPVTLIYSDGPMFINPYGPRRPLAMMKQEPYPTNAAALARVRELWGQEGCHNPFIMEESREFLWNAVQLAAVMEGRDLDAPLWRKVTIARAARDEITADANCKSLIHACSRAYIAKRFPDDVIIFRDRNVAAINDYVFYFSPAA